MGSSKIAIPLVCRDTGANVDLDAVNAGRRGTGGLPPANFRTTRLLSLIDVDLLIDLPWTWMK